jgi:hypothetical protein
MGTFEYLGGLPKGAATQTVEVTVRRESVRFQHGNFLRGWSHSLPLATITSVEQVTAEQAAARGITTPVGLHDEHFLAIEAGQGDGVISVILRGQWAELDELRQNILKGRMRAAKQWKS